MSTGVAISTSNFTLPTVAHFQVVLRRRRTLNLWAMGARRLIWIVNHKVLLEAELPILRDLGWEIFVPRILPSNDREFSSSATTDSFDATLSIAPQALEILKAHDFYRSRWPTHLTDIINEHFTLIVSSFSGYAMPLQEAARHFRGKLIARPFGREAPQRYSHLANGEFSSLLSDLGKMGDRFVFGQAYDNLASIEPRSLRRRAHTIVTPLAPSMFRAADAWSGRGGYALFVCRDIRESAYYRPIYERIKTHFGDLPHRIFGPQSVPTDDPSVCGFLSDEELSETYASAAVFAYPHKEPRHLHYSPLEAIVIGTPVLFLKGAMLGHLAGEKIPGACRDEQEMRAKVLRLLSGDRTFAAEVRETQRPILDYFRADLARQQWQRVIADSPPRSSFRERISALWA